MSIGRKQWLSEVTKAGRTFWGFEGGIKIWDGDIEFTIIKKKAELSNLEIALIALRLLSETIENADWGE
jgi:hypothetical protein